MRPRAGGASDACMRTDPMWRVAVGGSARALYTQAMCRVDGLCCARVCDLGGRGGRGTLKRGRVSTLRCSFVVTLWGFNIVVREPFDLHSLELAPSPLGGELTPHSLRAVSTTEVTER